jgi:hypothetical protein
LPWFALFFLRERRLRALLAICASPFIVIARAIALTILVFLTRSPTKKRVAPSSRPGRGIFRRSHQATISAL